MVFMRISLNYFNSPMNRTNFSDPITKLLNIFETTGPKNQQILNYSARATSNLTDNNNVCETIQNKRQTCQMFRFNTDRCTFNIVISKIQIVLLYA